MTAQVLAADATKARPVIAWYQGGAKRDCDAVWDSVPDKAIVTKECNERVEELRDRATQLRGVHGEGLARKKVAKALEELEDRLLSVKRATHRYGLALCARNFYSAYERYQAAAA